MERLFSVSFEAKCLFLLLVSKQFSLCTHLQLWHGHQQQNHQELPAGEPEGRRARLHHVLTSHHELPGDSTSQSATTPHSSARATHVLMLPVSLNTTALPLLGTPGYCLWSTTLV